MAAADKNTKSTETITLGGGCFWCLDAVYRHVKGVKEVVSGYAGGHVDNPDYYQVCSGATGHAEVVQLVYDRTVISLEQLLEIFWIIHDPTTPNQQGADIGPQYRSIILYHNEEQKKHVQSSVEKARAVWGDNITTEVVPLGIFYPAEEEHQDYFNRNPARAYCAVVINPKLEKFRSRHSGLMA